MVRAGKQAPCARLRRGRMGRPAAGSSRESRGGGRLPPFCGLENGALVSVEILQISALFASPRVRAAGQRIHRAALAARGASSHAHGSAGLDGGGRAVVDGLLLLLRRWLAIHGHRRALIRLLCILRRTAGLLRDRRVGRRGGLALSSRALQRDPRFMQTEQVNERPVLPDYPCQLRLSHSLCRSFARTSPFHTSFDMMRLRLRLRRGELKGR